MEKKLRASLLFMAVYMFWGFLYPQYALTEDMYELSESQAAAEKDCPRDYEGILSAEPGDVKIRISVLDKIEEWFGESETYEDRGN